MVYILRTTGAWRLMLSVGFAIWIATISTVSVGMPPAASGHLVDPHAFGTCAQLPAHVNLEGLTDTQLVTYGLPTHAVLDPNLAQWEHLLARNPQRVCARPTPLGFSISHLRQSANIAHDGCNPPQSGSSCPGNWDGKETLGSRGSYRYSDMYIYVPQATGSVNDLAGFWTGVGGDSAVAGSNPVLVQDGVITTVTSYGQYNESFVEVAPRVGAYNLPLCRLWAGDQLYALEESNYQNSGYDYFFMQNVTANCSNQCYVHTNNLNIQDTCGFTGGASFNSDSATAEDIAEWTGWSSGPPNLAHWNPSSNSTINMGPCTVDGQDFGAYTYFSEYIDDSSNRDVADSGALVGNTNFNLFWRRAN